MTTISVAHPLDRDLPAVWVVVLRPIDSLALRRLHDAGSVRIWLAHREVALWAALDELLVFVHFIPPVENSQVGIFAESVKAPEYTKSCVGIVMRA